MCGCSITPNRVLCSSHDIQHRDCVDPKPLMNIFMTTPWSRKYANQSPEDAGLFLVDMMAELLGLQADLKKGSQIETTTASLDGCASKWKQDNKGNSLLRMFWIVWDTRVTCKECAHERHRRELSTAIHVTLNKIHRLTDMVNDLFAQRTGLVLKPL